MIFTRKITFSYILTLLFLLAGCQTAETKPEDNTIKLIEVAPTLVDCTGVAPMKCMKIKEEGSTDWQLFYDQIEGFNYEEGYTYQLKVKITEKAEPIPADTSSLKWTLIDIINQKK